ncbi:hypothetical protein EHS25_007734 [Saitozyma podzolica]|uniref:YVC1 N-terminal linker helical domain-containing protein n=1 Tax=Saitozyma podzolica TaxID=1890683 RepID=A0A427YQJ1_9TREE|nr:hypothetical protein EHS25_007734 [Saitozyma podzolica]
MSAWLSKDPERSPLLRRPPVQRVVSSGGPTPEELARCDVFNTILLIRQDTIEHIDSPVGWAKMQEPEINYGIVRPLTDKYVALDNLAIVYCLLANRLQFIDDSNQLPQARLNLARAHLCELLAIRVLNHYAKATEPLQHPHMSHHHPTSLNPLSQGSTTHTHVGPSMFPGPTQLVRPERLAPSVPLGPVAHGRRHTIAADPSQWKEQDRDG